MSLTCSLVVRPRAMRTIWKQVKPMIGTVSRPMTTITDILAAQLRTTLYDTTQCNRRLCVCFLGKLLLLLLLLHPINGLFSRTTWVSRYQKGETSLDLNDAREVGVWARQWHQLDHMQTICTSLQTDNHANTSDALPDAQPPVSKLLY